MTWVKLDDQFADHPKVLEAGPLASWLYVCSLTYSARILTDGFIPKAQVRRLADVENAQELADKLVEVGLWDCVENGYQIHDYLDYNPSADTVKTKQESDRIRKNSTRNPHGIQQESKRPVPDPDPVSPLDPIPEDKLLCKKNAQKEQKTATPSHTKNKSSQFAEESDEYQLASQLKDRILKVNDRAQVPKTPAQMQNWAKEIHALLAKFTRQEIEQVLEFAYVTDDWWSLHPILSASKFHQHFPSLHTKLINQRGQNYVSPQKPLNFSRQEPSDYSKPSIVKKLIY
jgi:hypothetical protein